MKGKQPSGHEAGRSLVMAHKASRLEETELELALNRGRWTRRSRAAVSSMRERERAKMIELELLCHAAAVAEEGTLL